MERIPTANDTWIDPTEGQPKLIGSEWKRREPVEDAFDHVVVRGVFDCSNGNLELVVSPKTFGATLTCTAESLVDNYTRIGADGDPGERLANTINDLHARLLA